MNRERRFRSIVNISSGGSCPMPRRLHGAALRKAALSTSGKRRRVTQGAVPRRSVRTVRRPSAQPTVNRRHAGAQLRGYDLPVSQDRLEDPMPVGCLKRTGKIVPIKNSELNENMEFAHPPSSHRSGAQRISLVDCRHGDDLQISGRPSAGEPRAAAPTDCAPPLGEAA